MNRKKIISRDSFYKKLKQMTVVSGGYFGDEAKGKVVDSLVNRPNTSFVVRANSGANAGHTVVTKKGKKIVTHLIPSGITHKKIKNIIGPNCLLDPIGFYVGEVERLKDEGLDLTNLYIDNCFIVTPYHIIDDLLRGLASTGKGMSQVSKDKVSKTAIRLEDLLNMDLEKIEKNFNYWEDLVFGKSNVLKIKEKISKRVPEHLVPFLEIDETKRMEWYLAEFRKIRNFFLTRNINTKKIIQKEIYKKRFGVFEGAQSFYLSNDIETHFSSSTSSGTHALGTVASFPIPDFNEVEVISVVKVPSSRVGLGVNVGGLVSQDWFEKMDLKLENLKGLEFDFNKIYNEFTSSVRSDGTLENGNISSLKIGNKVLSVSEALAISQSIHYGEFGATTKRPRVTGFLDLLHLKNLIEKQGDHISLSCVDRLVGLKNILLIEKYVYTGLKQISGGVVYIKGMVIDLNDPLPSENIQKFCVPIYKKMKGFIKIIDGKNLDSNLEKFLNYIEKKTSAKIFSIGIGPKSDEIIYFD